MKTMTNQDVTVLHFEISIQAPAQKVYEIMLNEKWYGIWTGPFCPDSHFEGSWEKGSKIRFIGISENGKKGGMIGRITENIPNQFVSIEYTGFVDDDHEITQGPEAEKWIGGIEDYRFLEINGTTLLTVNSTATKEMQDVFLKAWPLALDKLKDICEQ